MRFFQLLLKVANHAALLAPTVRQTLDQQEKVGAPAVKKMMNTVEPPLTATSLQRPFFWPTVHTLTLVSTSLQWLLSSVPKVAVVEMFNCIREL